MDVAVIGLGMMGASIAKNLAKAGHSLKIFDVDTRAADQLASAGVTVASSPAEAGRGAKIAFLSLPGPEQIEEVCVGKDGLHDAMAAGGTIVDLSTNALDTVKKLESQLAQKGIAFLDAPVSGGPWGAADGTLAIWIGGNRKAYDDVRPVLDAIGKRIDYMGAIGNGTLTKLVHNAGANIRAVMNAEIMNLGIKAGIDPLALLKAIRQGSNGRQRTFDGAAGKYLDGTFDEPAFKLKLAHKDMRLAVELGEAYGVPMEMSQIAFKSLDEALKRGWGERDSGASVLVTREKAGVSFDPIDRATLAEVVASD